MKLFVLAASLYLSALDGAQAQYALSCSDLLKSNAQLDSVMKTEAARTAAAAAREKKVNDYCTKNPTVKASEAFENAMPE